MNLRSRLRPDGTLRNPVTIWVVRDGDDVYAESIIARILSPEARSTTIKLAPRSASS
jgi:hypothetical protein